MISTLVSVALAAAGQTTTIEPTAQPAIVTAPSTSATLTIPRDTPVELMATTEVSTADVSAGSHFKLRVNKPIEADGRVVIPVGAWAIGEVVTAKDSGGLGKSGKMTARLLYIEYGEARVPLEGDVTENGRGAGSAGTAFLLGGFMGLFHRGNNAKIKAGEIVLGFVSQEAVLDVSGPMARLVSTAPADAAAAPEGPMSPAAIK